MQRVDRQEACVTGREGRVGVVRDRLRLLGVMARCYRVIARMACIAMVRGRFVALSATVEPVQETLGCYKTVSLLDCLRDLVPVNALAVGGVEEHAEPIA